MDNNQMGFLEYQIKGCTIINPNTGETEPISKYNTELYDFLRIRDNTTGDDIWNELSHFFSNKFDEEQVDVNDLDISFRTWKRKYKSI